MPNGRATRYNGTIGIVEFGTAHIAGFPSQDNTMRHASVVLKIVLLFSLFILLLASPAVAFAQAPDSRGTIVIPRSSVERPQDAGKRAHTNIVLFDLGLPANPSFTPPHTSSAGSVNPQAGPTSGKFFETPASLACVYGLTAYVAGCSPAVVTENPAGGSRALAIVDSYDDPNAAADLAAFDLQFGIPAANFQVVYATGAKPPVDPTGGWELEESLDIEWAHAMAPNAALFLVEAASNKKADLLTAVSVASALVAQAGGGEVSMSWGTAESPKEAASESYFATPGVVYFASSGDSPGALWPSVSPSVVSSGGTTVSRNPTTGAFQLEVAWASTGSGPSAYFPIPSYQSSVAAIVGKNRGTPDLAFDADPHTGVWIYDSYPLRGVSSATWHIVGGTSIAAPSLAGIVNAAGNFHASSAAELAAIYSSFGRGSGFADIQSGTCYHYAGYLAAPGWDYCSGVGSVNGYEDK
jgi:subtilase family serine protease